MKTKNTYKPLFLLYFYLFILTGLVACDQQPDAIENQKIATVPIQTKTIVLDANPQADKIIIENKNYLFDITDHSQDEFRALLTRAEEISQTQTDEFSDLKIVLVIHGPDIEWFTQQNYQDNQQLIDLAARLDAYGVIDMKVCEKTMSILGVARDDIPPFIESVPYGPLEIEHRLREGYINL